MEWWRRFLRDVRHQLDGTFYERPLRLTPIRALRLAMMPELQVLFWYRLSNAMWYSGFRGFRQLAGLVYLRGRRLGADISPEAKIGPGLRIVHSMDIAIGPEATLGEDVVCMNGVSVGNRVGHGAGMPVVGDRVLLGTGSKILGPIDIGDGAMIGANAVVLTSVPPGARAVGVPARVLPPKTEAPRAG